MRQREAAEGTRGPAEGRGGRGEEVGTSAAAQVADGSGGKSSRQRQQHLGRGSHSLSASHSMPSIGGEGRREGHEPGLEQHPWQMEGTAPLGRVGGEGGSTGGAVKRAAKKRRQPGGGGGMG